LKSWKISSRTLLLEAKARVGMAFEIMEDFIRTRLLEAKSKRRDYLLNPG